MKEVNPFTINQSMIVWGIATAVLVFLLVIGLTRLFGLRSFARLSTFDFAFTLAKGALIASIAVSDHVGFFEGALGLFIIYLGEWTTGYLRIRYNWFTRLVNNRPILLMQEGQFLRGNMLKARISEEDITFALRQNNVQELSQVAAVIAEPTGQISVLTGSAETVQVLLRDVVK